MRVSFQVASKEKLERNYVIKTASGDVYHVDVLTKSLFDEQIKKNLLHPPKNNLSTDQEVQNFLRNFNPLDPGSSPPRMSAAEKTKARIANFNYKKD
jgi:hypothetical protein